MVWLPPAYKGAAGAKSVGYDVYDTYDLSEFPQKGSIATKYGRWRDYQLAVRRLRAQRIEVLADVVLNHMMGADTTVGTRPECAVTIDGEGYGIFYADNSSVAVWVTEQTYQCLCAQME